MTTGNQTPKGDQPDDGGPAFPRAAGESSRWENEAQVGMSLWDYYAAAALNSMYECYDDEYAAKKAAERADAMLAERKKRFS